MQLPIEVIPGSRPPRFRWRYLADTPNGRQAVEQEGSLPPSMEGAMQRLISLVKQLQTENAGLQEQVNCLIRQVEEKAEAPVRQPAQPAQPAPTGKRGGR